MTTAAYKTLERAINECAADIDALYAQCAESAPNYGVAREEFIESVTMAINKYLARSVEGSSAGASTEDVRQLLSELQASDLYLALACARGNEFAWWDFDANYRRFVERIAQHLASAGADAEEVVDFVYTELYGTRVVEGIRQSKFATYTGRGTLRGWLRAVVWHTIVDLHRARRDEISIDDWSEGGGETDDRPGWRAQAHAGERAMVESVTRERYGAPTLAALDAAFAALDDHEKLLLLYYHVEGLKLREIARLVEEPRSPLRRWFQRQSKRRNAIPQSRVHESTVMRWLEKVYARVHERFRDDLRDKSGFSDEEIAVCIQIAGGDMAPENLRRHLTNVFPEPLSKGKTE